MDRASVKQNRNVSVPILYSGGRIHSRDLLGERRELIIEHQGREYRLRLTQNGKLILTA